MNIAKAAQDGVITDPTPHVEYLTLALKAGKLDDKEVAAALSAINLVAKSIRQKDTTADLTITTGFSQRAWEVFFPDKDLPAQLRAFPELRDDDRYFPSTAGDIFFMTKSQRLDLNFQATRYLIKRFASVAEVVDDTQGFRYLDDRDLTDFVDGTANPIEDERIKTVLLDADADYPGGSYLLVQRYVDQPELWDALATHEQEDIIGRTKMDDIEQSADVKKPFAHNKKSKVKRDGKEMKMFRQNRAWGTGARHGTIFVGFAADLTVLEDSLRQMITADEDGYYDHLLDFVKAETGMIYFIPPAELVTGG